MKPLLELKNVYHTYASDFSCNNLSFALKQGEIGCLLGPSGCGKTTILRLIAGLEPVLMGVVKIDGQVISDCKSTLSPTKRNIGMVFQDYALFPHLTVGENIAFGIRNLPRPTRQTKVTELVDMMDLGAQQDKYVHEISGGQQQRVALARALAPRPRLLLLDEPFSNLDVTMREKLCLEVKTILHQCGVTALMVTHNQQEAFAIADVIGVMNNGSLEQWASAHQIYHRPDSPFVANFIGEGVLIKGVVSQSNSVSTGLGVLRGEFQRSAPIDAQVSVLMRPDDIVHSHESRIKARVLAKTFRGANILYRLLLDNGEELLSIVPSHHDHDLGSKIGIKPVTGEIVIF